MCAKGKGFHFANEVSITIFYKYRILSKIRLFVICDVCMIYE